MSWLITPQLKVLNGVPEETIIGIPFGGGYFAGYISHTADGSPTHALIVAPAETGATGTGYTLTANLAWKPAASATAGTNSSFDGVSNTNAMVTAGIAAHPAAEFCVNLSIGGFTDWYLPAHLELEIAYFNLKPTTASNSTTTGSNIYAVPRRNASYTSQIPTQTTNSLFQAAGLQPFVADRHWSSTEADGGRAANILFSSGEYRGAGSSLATKQTLYKVRAFRRIAL
jgi:hypothetical protein